MTDDREKIKQNFVKLQQQYGTKDTRRAINRAIRAEIPGGDVALDNLATAHVIARRNGGVDSHSNEAHLYRLMLEIVDAMEDGIREKWGLSPRKDRDDNRRRGTG